MSDPTDAAPESTEQTTDDAAQNEPLTADALDAEEAAAWAEVQAEERGEEPPKSDPEPKKDAPAPDSESDAGGAAESAEAKGDNNAPADSADDANVWADASPELKAAYEAERARAAQAEHGRRSAEGRQRALEQRLSAMMAGQGRPQRTNPAGNNPSKPAPTTGNAPASDDAWSKFEEDFPDVAAPVKGMVGRLEAKLAKLEEENATLKTSVEVVGAERLDAAYSAQEDRVRAEHPEFDKISDPNDAMSSDFSMWLTEQPAYVQRAALENAEVIRDADTTNSLIASYKRDRGLSDGTPQNARPEPEPEPDPLRTLQRRTVGTRIRPSPSPSVPEGGRRTETESDVWAEVQAEERKRLRSEAA